MQLNTHVDIELVAVEQPDEITVLLELKAPEAPTTGRRAPAAVQVVLDRSGSMDGERLDAAKRALIALIDRLDPNDRFGVVAFDDEVQVVAPAGPLADKLALEHAVASVSSGGMTNLSGGLLRGLQEARRVATDAGATVLLLSDGHANQGILEHDKLAAVAANARDHGVTTSTIGIGLDYDETLLAAVARGRAGRPRLRARRRRGRRRGGRGGRGAAVEDGPGREPHHQADRRRGRDHGLERPAVARDRGRRRRRARGPVGRRGAQGARHARRAGDVGTRPGAGRDARADLRRAAGPRRADGHASRSTSTSCRATRRRAGCRTRSVANEVLYQRAQESKRRGAEALNAGDVDAARAEYQSAYAVVAAADDPELAARPRSSPSSTATSPPATSAGPPRRAAWSTPRRRASAAVTTDRCESVRSWPEGPTRGVWV